MSAATVRKRLLITPGTARLLGAASGQPHGLAGAWPDQATCRGRVNLARMGDAAAQQVHVLMGWS